MFFEGLGRAGWGIGTKVEFVVIVVIVAIVVVGWWGGGGWGMGQWREG